MDECRHRNSCNPNCSLYVTNDQFKEKYQEKCVLDVIWKRLNKIQEALKGHRHSGYADNNHEHYGYADSDEMEVIQREIRRMHSEGNNRGIFPGKHW